MAAAIALLAEAFRSTPVPAPMLAAKVIAGVGLEPVHREVHVGDELDRPAAGGVVAVVGRQSE